MHATLHENMQGCYEQYVCGTYFQNHDHIIVLDIKSIYLDGSFADIFSPKNFEYVSVQMAPEAPYKLDFDDESVDVVVTGQTLQNVEFFWILFQEMARVVKRDGWIFLIAPSDGPTRHSSVECYRFHPGAYRSLAKYTGLNLVKQFQDPRGPWKDLVGIFSNSAECDRNPVLPWRAIKKEEVNRYLSERLPAGTKFERRSPELELVRGKGSYLAELENLHDCLAPSLYVEIGVRKGKSLALSKSPTIAVDPDPDIDPGRFGHVELFRMPSDYFFEQCWPLDSNRPPVDFAFIDGMHLFEFVLRDFINLEARSSENTVIVVDDIFPNHVKQASRQRETRTWTGDVWKFLVCLRTYRPDLKLTMLDVRPTGLLIISGLDKKNRTLLDQYNTVVEDCISLNLDSYQDLILNRSEAKPVRFLKLKRIKKNIQRGILRMLE